MSNQPSLHVNWSAPKSDCLIQYYQVDYRVGNSGSWSIWIPNPTSTSVILTDLQKGTTYQVRVRAVSEVGNGTWSDTANQTTSDGMFPVSHRCKMSCMYTNSKYVHVQYNCCELLTQCNKLIQNQHTVDTI